MDMNFESDVRSYCRSFPETFDTALGASVFSTTGRRYVDFLSGCGSLNYGHNNPILRNALVSYIEKDGITMSMDMETASKVDFMEAFSNLVLRPRGLNYKMQFTGPTGANAVEAAIKLARKITGRSNVLAFTNAFHGCSLGALALTGSGYHRQNSEALLTNVIRAPYDGYWGPDIDTSVQLERLLTDPSSGYDLPAAIIVEAIQGEGGLNVATAGWIQHIARIAREHEILLIIDDIQAGCGRSGDFFSFEVADIKPDIVCLAKSISGFGLPMSLVLLDPKHDVWEPGEHNGTFRGNNYAFVTATAAIREFWSDQQFRAGIHQRSNQISSQLHRLAQTFSDDLSVKGRGMMLGLEFSNPNLSKLAQRDCFNAGLIIELGGPNDEVLKLLPPLNISSGELDQGLETISEVVSSAIKRKSAMPELVFG